MDAREALAQAAGYVFFATPVLLAAAVTVTLVLLVALPVLGRRRIFPAVKGVFVFTAALYLVGFAGSLIFASIFRDRLYYAADPFVDWLPFLPLMNFTLDPVCGGHLLNGATPFQFYLAWFAVGLPVWSVSALVSRKLLKRRRKPAAV